MQTCASSEKTIATLMYLGSICFKTDPAAMQRPIASASRFPSRSKQSRLLSRRIRFRVRMSRARHTCILPALPGKHRIAILKRPDIPDHSELCFFVAKSNSLLLKDRFMQCGLVGINRSCWFARSLHAKANVRILDKYGRGLCSLAQLYMYR